ncbi:ketoacyl-ACP synthase III [bacterium]|nr:ketoacyl-ACP synthase III [bacterium]MBU1676684.1 ketoacyl-ACP synthase III [bacterium]
MAQRTLQRAGLTGLGMSFPERVLTNADFEKMVDTNDAWIVERTGIRERRVVEKGTPASHHGALAARDALAHAGIDPADLDLLLVPTVTPDMTFPATACVIQKLIGADHAWGFDIEAACSGFIYALETARAYVESGLVRNALVVGTEIMSMITDYTDRNTCILFGDGAGAVAVQPVDPADGGIIDAVNHMDGMGIQFLHQKAGGSRMPPSAETVANKLHYVYQEGREVYKHAVRGMANVALEIVERNNLDPSDVKLLVPHQANIRIIEAAQKRLGLADEQVSITIDRYGNTTSASIPSALKVAYDAGRVKRGDHVVLVSFGAGFTWGASLIRWCID